MAATTLLTAEVVERTTDVTNIPLLRNYFDQYHILPKCVVGDKAFMTENWETFYNSLHIRPVSLDPMTPWPHRAGTRSASHQETKFSLMSNSIKAGIARASLKAITITYITYKQLVKAAATAKIPLFPCSLRHFPTFPFSSVGNADDAGEVSLEVLKGRLRKAPPPPPPRKSQKPWLWGGVKRLGAFCMPNTPSVVGGFGESWPLF